MQSEKEIFYYLMFNGYIRELASESLEPIKVIIGKPFSLDGGQHEMRAPLIAVYTPVYCKTIGRFHAPLCAWTEISGAQERAVLEVNMMLSSSDCMLYDKNKREVRLDLSYFEQWY